MSLLASTKTLRSFLGWRLCHNHNNGSLSSCETGDSLTVLSQLGHLCLVPFFQTTHLGNLFAAFVALLRNPNETATSQSRNSGGQLTVTPQFQEHVSINYIYGSKGPHLMNMWIKDKDGLGMPGGTFFLPTVGLRFPSLQLGHMRREDCIMRLRMVIASVDVNVPLTCLSNKGWQRSIWYDRYSLNALDALALPVVATQLRNEWKLS